MPIRTNAGYTITDSITIGDTEFVLGVDKEAPDTYVTWRCSNGNYYFWGHYTSDLLAAKKDLLERAGDALEKQLYRQEKKPAEREER